MTTHDRVTGDGDEAATHAFGGVLSALVDGQETARRTISMVPSENVLSPMARLPLVLDTYSRYFFDHLRMFGAWSFFGGLDAGRIEQEILTPLLLRLAAATHVNAQPVSGLNCMTVAMSALTSPGDTVLLVPTDGGGHMSTAGVAGRLGLRVAYLPMADPTTVDYAAVAPLLRAQRPALVYLDQSTLLFPIDPAPLRAAIEGAKTGTLLHFDSSHLNGLILAGALPNPLDRGAHTFGGSTHKTLPGPHKGFLATRDEKLARRIDDAAAVLVSHHHPAEVASLAITLLELEHRGGAEYARRVLGNARVLAGRLHERGAVVQAADRGFTGCHQVWVDPVAEDGGVAAADALFAAGVAVNRVGVPGVTGSALRLSVAEVTRLGADEDDVTELADILADVVVDGRGAGEVGGRVDTLRGRLSRPRYCFTGTDLLRQSVPEWLRALAAGIEAATSTEVGAR